MDNSRDAEEERGITKDNRFIEKWYQELVDDCHAIITEAIYISRWALVEGYHNLGKRILEEHDNFERAKIYGEKIVQGLAESLNMSSRVLWYAVRFVQKYPDLSKVPEGKNITWSKIITKYLTTGSRTTQQEYEYTVTCPQCGLEYQCPKCGRKYKL